MRSRNQRWPGVAGAVAVVAIAVPLIAGSFAVFDLVDVVSEGTGGVTGLGTPRQIDVAGDGFIHVVSTGSEALTSFSISGEQLLFEDSLPLTGLAGDGDLASQDGVEYLVVSRAGNWVRLVEPTGGGVLGELTFQDGPVADAPTSVAAHPSLTRTYYVGSRDLTNGNRDIISAVREEPGRSTGTLAERRDLLLPMRGGVSLESFSTIPRTTSAENDISVAVLPSGDQAFFGFSEDDALGYSALNGQGSFVGPAGSVDNTTLGFTGLSGVSDVDVSPDSEHVYTASTGDGDPGAITAFTVTGAAPTLIESYESNGLRQFVALAVSPSGTFVAASDTAADAIVVFGRNLVDGSLTEIGEYPISLRGGPLLEDPLGLAWHPDGYLLVVGSGSDSVELLEFPELFGDGYETGDTSQWSSVQP